MSQNFEKVAVIWDTFSSCFVLPTRNPEEAQSPLRSEGACLAGVRHGP